MKSLSTAAGALVVVTFAAVAPNGPSSIANSVRATGESHHLAAERVPTTLIDEQSRILAAHHVRAYSNGQMRKYDAYSDGALLPEGRMTEVV